jgi:hypothetical protein
MLKTIAEDRTLRIDASSGKRSSWQDRGQKPRLESQKEKSQQSRACAPIVEIAAALSV